MRVIMAEIGTPNVQHLDNIRSIESKLIEFPNSMVDAYVLISKKEEMICYPVDRYTIKSVKE